MSQDNAMSLPIEEAMAGLADLNKELTTSNLTVLSALGSDEVEYFEQSWSAIGTKRRRQIVSRMVELAENDVTLDYADIFKSCLKDPDEEIRRLAIQGLWECEELSLISPLIRLLEEDASEDVRSAAAGALGKFAMLAELGKLRSAYADSVTQVLISTIEEGSSSTEVRRRALEAAAPLNLPQVSRAIMKAYQSGDFKLQVSAVYSMGKNCDSNWLPILLKELNNKNAEMRYEAAGACGELGEEEAVIPLAKLFNDDDIEVRLAAIQALGKVGGSQAKEFLGSYMNTTDDLVSSAAKQALEELRAGEDIFSL